MWCRVCRIDIENGDAQNHLDIHIVQHKSGQKLKSIYALNGNSTDTPDSVMAAFEAGEDTPDDKKMNLLLTKLFV
jgi:hypothetical protein